MSLLMLLRNAMLLRHANLTTHGSGFVKVAARIVVAAALPLYLNLLTQVDLLHVC